MQQVHHTGNHIARVSLSQPAPKHFNISVGISEDEAVCWLDAGRTELQWCNLERTLFELRAYRSMGYKLIFGRA